MEQRLAAKSLIKQRMTGLPRCGEPPTLHRLQVLQRLQPENNARCGKLFFSIIPSFAFQTAVMVKVTTLDTEFELLPDESLLAGLERTNHAVEYQCRSGYCGSCRVKLLAGKVSYREMPMAYVADGEILSCCCVLESDVVVGCCLRDDGARDDGDD